MEVTMTNKQIGRKEAAFLGGKPAFTEFFNEDETKSLDILKCKDTPQEGVNSYGTVGLNYTDIRLTSGGKKLRVELLSAIDRKIEEYENIIATAAFCIMDTKRCFPGYVVPNVIREYIPDCEMRHLLLTYPFLWEDTESMEFDDRIVAWLQAVPISDNEFEYLKQAGLDALEDLFEEKDVDVLNIYRKSVL